MEYDALLMLYHINSLCSFHRAWWLRFCIVFWIVRSVCNLINLIDISWVTWNTLDKQDILISIKMHSTHTLLG